ncbi:MAG TPA: hypothetical protein VFM95_01890 [Microcella sp.]|nr:hypothetical protein [Microcella sp.]
MTGRFRTVVQRDSALIEDADRQFIEALGPAIRRQVWLRFETPDSAAKGVVIQLDQLPVSAPPDAAAALTNVMEAVLQQGEFTTVSPVFERSGGPEPTTRDREWMHAVHLAADRAGLEIGLVLISHSRGVRAYVERPDG